MRRQLQQQTPPPGWFAVEPAVAAADRPPGAAKCRASDSLGLSRPSNPLHFPARKPSASVGTMKRNQAGTPPTSRDDGAARQAPSQRHRKLVGASDSRGEKDVAMAFSPQRSLRLAQLPVRPTPPSASVREQGGDDLRDVLPAVSLTSGIRRLSSGGHARVSSQSRKRDISPSLPAPLHELIQTVAEGAFDMNDSVVQLNRASVVTLLMEQWQSQFDDGASIFKSIAVRYEVGLRELQQLTVNLPTPNEIVTAYCCKTLGEQFKYTLAEFTYDLIPNFGGYAEIVKVAAAEIRMSIYHDPDHGRVPYFALVQYQKRLLRALESDRDQREQRNELLARDIDHVLSTFRRFLTECARGLLRTIIREWHSIAIVHKKNSKKYIEYFSAWFSSSAKTFVPKIFAVWKRQTSRRKLQVAQTQLSADSSTLLEIQRQVNEATALRDGAQLELHAVRNDRKQLEDLVQKLTRKIQSANAYLETCHRREPLVANEGHLRVEAVSFLPPLVLESLLRGYHGLGFLQHGCTSGSKTEACTTAASITRRASQTSVEATINTPGAFIRHIFSLVIDMQAKFVQSDIGVAVTIDSPEKLPLGRLEDSFIDIFSQVFRRVQDQILQASSIAKVVFDIQSDNDSAISPTASLSSLAAENTSESAIVCSEYEELIKTMRLQDEHYARHQKLFSARLLESHEVSILPSATLSVPTPHLSQSTRVECPALQGGSSDLGIINGIRRFSIANLPVPILNGFSAVSGRRRLGSDHHLSVSQLPSRESAEVSHVQSRLVHEQDFQMSRTRVVNLMAVLIARIATEYGGLLFSPSDMTVFTHNPYTMDDFVQAAIPQNQDESKRMSPTDPGSTKPPATSTFSFASAILRTRFQTLLKAYDSWNRLSGQLVETGFVQSRSLAGSELVTPETSIPALDDAAPEGVEQSLFIRLPNSDAALRPSLLHQLELLPQSSLLVSASKESTSPGRRVSVAGGAGLDQLQQASTTAAARLRRIATSIDLPGMIVRMGDLHGIVKSIAEQQCDFRLARQQMRDLQQLQWSQACQLASSSAEVDTGIQCNVATSSSSSVSDRDTRPHLFECVSFENSIVSRLLGVEREPAQELQRVRSIMEKKQIAFRQLYSRHRAASLYALSLDELWHVVKLLRLPREVHSLSPPTPSQQRHNGEDDEEEDDMFSTTSTTPNGGDNNCHEQLFSPEDLVEALLLLCNEQFPHLPTLSARVDHFSVHHLPFAASSATNSSSARSRFFPGGVRDILHQSDVRRALSDHSQTLRVIFRRYCAKERDIQVSPATPAGHGASHIPFAPGGSAVPTNRPLVMLRGARAKFMRMGDWIAFVQDYHLLRARFTLERALGVFRGVLGQEAADKDTVSPDSGLEMAYGAFCEAVVAMALCFNPDPFVKNAAKVSHFVNRFLPVAPEEAHDVAAPVSATK